MKQSFLSFMFFGALLTGSALAASGQGTYAVPVPESLLEVSTFHLEEVSWMTGPNGLRKLHYILPEDLVGTQEIRIDMQGELAAPGDFFQLNGAMGSAVCSKTISGVTCLIRTPSLTLQQQDVIHFLQNKYNDDPTLLNKRLGVASIFGREPIGVVSITFDH